MGSAQRLAQPNLLGALGDRNQHDVNNADCAQSQSHQSHHSEKAVHGVENLCYTHGIVYGVPVVEGVFHLGIKAVAARDNFMHFLLGVKVLFLGQRSVIDERDGILAVFTLQREEHAHSFYRHEDAAIGAVITFFADLFDNADDVEVNAVQQDGAAHRRPAGKHILEQFPAHNGNTTMLSIVFLVEPAPRVHGHGADVGVLGSNTENLAIGAAILADSADIFAVQHRREGTQELGFIADCEVVIIGKVIWAS